MSVMGEKIDNLTETESIQSAIKYKNIVEQMRKMSSEDLHSVLGSDNGPGMLLSAYSIIPVRHWFTPWSVFIVQYDIWDAIKIHKRMGSGQSNGISSTNNISIESAELCIRSMAAFIELYTRNDERILDFINQRSKSEPSLLDICIVGYLLWEKNYNLLPSYNQNAFDPFEVRPKVVQIPGETVEFWESLSKSRNGLYRSIAFGYSDKWTNDVDLSAVSDALADEYLITQEVGLQKVKYVPVEEQVMLLEKYLSGSTHNKETDRTHSDARRMLEKAKRNRNGTEGQKMHPRRSGTEKIENSHSPDAENRAEGSDLEEGIGVESLESIPLKNL
jgi:hypothetical protein